MLDLAKLWLKENDDYNLRHILAGNKNVFAPPELHAGGHRPPSYGNSTLIGTERASLSAFAI